MITKVPLQYIAANNWQTRHHDPDPEHIEELAADIAAHGLLHTPVGRLYVSKSGKLSEAQVADDGMIAQVLGDLEVAYDADYFWKHSGVLVQLAFGHNRLAAYRYLHEQEVESWTEQVDKDQTPVWDAMPVDLRELSDEQMAIFAWSENEKRRDNNPLDRALSIQERIETFKWTQAMAAEHLGISRPSVSNLLRLLTLPEEITQALGKGEISERQAMALAGMFDLPEEMVKSVDARLYQGHQYKPSEIIRDALKGESSEKIRERVNGLTRQFGKSLNEASWSLDEVMQGNDVRSATCRECEKRLKERNICLEPACFEVKKRAVEGLYLANASLKSGIQSLEAGVEHYLTEFGWTGDFETIRQAGCENLRLMYRDRNGNERSDDLHELGYPNAVVVCQKRAGQCSCLKGIDYARQQRRAKQESNSPIDTADDSEGEEPVIDDREPEYEAVQGITEAHIPSAEELQELARQARSEKRQIGKAVGKVKESLAQMLNKGLVDDELGAWRLLAQKLDWHLGLENTEGKDIELVRQMICEQVAQMMLPMEPSTEAGLMQYVNCRLKRVGMRGLILLDDGEMGFQEKDAFPVFPTL